MSRHRTPWRGDPRSELLAQKRVEGGLGAFGVEGGAFAFAALFLFAFAGDGREFGEEAEVGLHGLKIFGRGVGDIVAEGADHGAAGQDPGVVALEDMGHVDAGELAGGDVSGVAFDTGDLSGKKEIVAGAVL